MFCQSMDMMIFMEDLSKMSLQFPQVLLVSTNKPFFLSNENSLSISLAQFLYTRESRAAPSLLSFIDTSGGGDISRSVSEPYKSNSKSKLTTSPLASSSVSTSTTTLGKEIIGNLYSQRC